MARLVGVPAAVHVRQVEAADGAQPPWVGEEPADRGRAADLRSECVVLPQEVADVFGPLGEALKQVMVELVRFVLFGREAYRAFDEALETG